MKTLVKIITPVFVLLLFSGRVEAQFIADAGPDKVICLGDSVELGGSPTGPSGASFQWNNSTTLDTATLSNPIAFPTVSTVYTVTATDNNGRSATDQVSVMVTIPDTVNAGRDTIICKGDTIQIGGSPTAPAGASFSWNNKSSLDFDTLANPKAFPSSTTTYIVTMTDQNGCTNTDTITVSLLDATASENGSILTADVIGATYQWIDCNGGDTAITGATEQTYTAISNGSYAVEITVGNCIDTSDCISVISVGLNETKEESVFDLYPNPSSGELIIKSKSPFTVAKSLYIYSVDGKLVYQKELINTSSILNLDKLNSGIYYIYYQNQAKKFVINRP